MTLIPRPKHGYWPHLAPSTRVEVRRTERTFPAQHGPAYEVFVDAVPVGFVFRSERTWERRTPGKRFVNARGETSCWRFASGSGEARQADLRARTFDTRGYAAYHLAESRRQQEQK